MFQCIRHSSPATLRVEEPKEASEAFCRAVYDRAEADTELVALERGDAVYHSQLGLCEYLDRLHHKGARVLCAGEIYDVLRCDLSLKCIWHAHYKLLQFENAREQGNRFGIIQNPLHTLAEAGPEPFKRIPNVQPFLVTEADINRAIIRLPRLVDECGDLPQTAVWRFLIEERGGVEAFMYEEPPVSVARCSSRMLFVGDERDFRSHWAQVPTPIVATVLAEEFWQDFFGNKRFIDDPSVSVPAQILTTGRICCSGSAPLDCLSQLETLCGKWSVALTVLDSAD